MYGELINLVKIKFRTTWAYKREDLYTGFYGMPF